MTLPPAFSGTALQAAREDPRFIAVAKALGRDAQLQMVGGTVRDALLGSPPKDIDLATILPVEEVMRLLEQAGIRVIPTGLKHSTISALPCAGEPVVEITTFRAPPAHPGIRRSLTDDLKLRDFTVNAMAYDPRTEELFDPTGGLADLQARVVRSVGAAEERFLEDPLRLLRAVRFSVQLTFDLDAETALAARTGAGLLNAVSTERIRDEFSKILLSADPARGMRMLLELNLLAQFLPEISRTAEFEQNRFHKADLFEHTLHVIAACRPELTLRLAALLHDVGKVDTLTVDPQTGDRHFFRHEFVGAQQAAEILERLRYPKGTVAGVQTLVRTHMRPLEAGPGGLRRLLRDTAELFPSWRELKEADASACKIDPALLARQLKSFDAAMEDVQKGPPVSPLSSLAVNGHDLIAIGFRPGPALGAALNGLHEQVLDNPALNEKTMLLELARQYLDNDVHV